MVISQFYPLVGGTEKQAQLLAKKLIEKGVTLHLTTGAWKFGAPRKEIIDGIRIIRNFCGWGMFGMNKYRAIRVLGGIIYIITLGTYLLFHGRKYDLIHVHQFLYPAFVSVLIGKILLKIPVLVKSASSGTTGDIELLKQFPLGNFQLKFLLKELNHLVAISNATGRDFKEIGYPESKISYIPNGVEIPVLLKNSNDQVTQVITITRLSIEKGVDILLKAWAEVIREKKDLKLLIVGYGPLASQLKMLSRSLGTTGSVDFVGLIENTSKYLQKSDLFVLPSRSEGLSNALLEAMSYGIACIATKVGGNGELLRGEYKEIPVGSYMSTENGCLINSEDVKGLSEAILFLLRDRTARKEMGQKGRQFIQENYSIDSVVERYMALYQSILLKR